MAKPRCWVSIGKGAWKEARILRIDKGSAQVDIDGDIRDVHIACIHKEKPRHRRALEADTHVPRLSTLQAAKNVAGVSPNRPPTIVREQWESSELREMMARRRPAPTGLLASREAR